MQIVVAPFQRLVTRTMTCTEADGTSYPIYIDLGVPFIVPPDDPADDELWGCQYQSRGFANDDLLTVFGVDGIQALYMAMSLAGVRIAAQPESLLLDWGGVVNFGFPPIVAPLPTTGSGGTGTDAEEPDLKPIPGI